jgi:hypothetical protein
MARNGDNHKGGRPSKAEELRLIETIIRAGQESTGENDPLQLLWKSVWDEAKAGSKDHQKFVLEYTYGKPKQQIQAEVTGPQAPVLVFQKADGKQDTR